MRRILILFLFCGYYSLRSECVTPEGQIGDSNADTGDEVKFKLRNLYWSKRS